MQFFYSGGEKINRCLFLSKINEPLVSLEERISFYLPFPSPLSIIEMVFYLSQRRRKLMMNSRFEYIFVYLNMKENCKMEERFVRNAGVHP